jgi:hypothetical protein
LLGFVLFCFVWFCFTWFGLVLFSFGLLVPQSQPKSLRMF